MKSAYLVLVQADVNHNKFYRMSQITDNKFEVEFGRIGAKGRKQVYSMSRWDSVYESKLGKGYEDQTENHIVSKQSVYKPIENEAIRSFFESIERFSSEAIARIYSISYDTVTESMIVAAERKIQQLSRISDTTAANQILNSLFQIMPRKMKVVSDYMTTSLVDIPKIIQREYDLLDVMKARVIGNSQVPKNGQTVLDAMDLQIAEVSKLEEQQIKKFMAAESRGKYKRAFRVRNKRTDERFFQFMEENGYSSKDIHYLYHGSRNENWYGLMKRGPLLAPKGVTINGKMFGNGLYFANRARKSIGYTSLDGACWTSGRSSTGFLAVFKVLYKNPLYVQTNHQYSLQELGEHDAVFAQKGAMLRNDEIIVFREQQATLQYIIELQC